MRSAPDPQVAGPESGWGSRFQKRRAGLPAIILSIIALIAYFLWLSHLYLGPKIYPPTAASLAFDAWKAKLARESGGDITKIRPEDRARLERTYMGHGREALKDAYDQQRPLLERWFGKH